MIKKLLIVACGGMLLLALFFGREAYSYVSTTFDWVKQSAKSSVPVDFEIKRARKMITKLEPKIEDARRAIIVEATQVKRLQASLEDRDARLAKGLADIKRLRGDLERGDSNYVYSGKSYTVAQVEGDLEKRFKLYKKQKSTADTLRQTIETRLRGIEEAKEKFREMEVAREQLLADIENLQARQNMVKVAKASSKVRFDDSHLARTQKLVDEIEARIAVSEEMTSANTEFTGQIQLDGPTSGNVLQEIDEYLDGKGPEASEVVLD